MKSTVDEIRARFDAEVERFSNLSTGQSATIDAPLVLELISETAASVTPNARALIDVGCGAGNYTLKLLARLPHLDCTLIDLSAVMLARAVERVSAVASGTVTPMQGDIRALQLPARSADIIVAAAVLHHLRETSEWEAVFNAFYQALRPGGSIWISDLIAHDDPAVQAIMWRRYGEYLSDMRGGGEAGDAYQRQVFAYVEKEDTPRSLEYQVDLLKRCGFERVTVLHKNGPFAAFGGVKPRDE